VPLSTSATPFSFDPDPNTVILSEPPTYNYVPPTSKVDPYSNLSQPALQLTYQPAYGGVAIKPESSYQQSLPVPQSSEDRTVAQIQQPAVNYPALGLFGVALLVVVSSFAKPSSDGNPWFGWLVGLSVVATAYYQARQSLRNSVATWRKVVVVFWLGFVSLMLVAAATYIGQTGHPFVSSRTLELPAAEQARLISGGSSLMALIVVITAIWIWATKRADRKRTERGGGHLEVDHLLPGN